jgi:hypothetical protein
MIKHVMMALVLTVATPAFAQDALPDPVRLSAAKPVVDKLWPLGTYRRMMDGTMSKMMDGMIAQMFDMRASDMAAVDGKAAASGDKTLGQVATERDPHFRERMSITMKTMMDEMLPLMEKMEPKVREGLTNVYARRYTNEQLADMDRFFATPSGKAYAEYAMMVFTDPEIIKGMQSFTPELLKAMPGIMEKAKQATAHLPPPPKSTSADNDGK